MSRTAQRAYELIVIVVAVGGVAYSLPRVWAFGTLDLLLWILVVAAVELAPVQFGRVQVSMGFPILIAVALLYEPAVAGLVALVGAFDPREFRLKVDILRALFNRSQVCLAVVAGSVAFHAVADIEDRWWVALVGALMAAAADWMVNVVLVAVFIRLGESVSLRSILRRLVIGNPFEFIVSYLGLGALGVVLAKLYLEVGFWSVALFIVPLFLARQMFFRSRALEEAHTELQDREKVLRRLSNRMAEERQDERMQIAAYLHDDLAQLLFQLSLQVDLAERLLREDDLEGARKHLAEVRATKEVASERMRALVQDLHRSPLGRKGLSEAIASFTAEVGKGTSLTFDLAVTDLPLPPPIQLLVYQIAHEAVMNALKYAEASTIQISLEERAEAAELIVRDDGKGFDAEAGEPEGHFGLTMMRERAQVAGGTFDVVSAREVGTAITVRIPASWLQRNGAPAPEEEVPDPTPRPPEGPGPMLAGPPAPAPGRRTPRRTEPASPPPVEARTDSA